MRGLPKIPPHWKPATITFLKKILVFWFRFWKNWHYVKYYYYNSSRHLVKTRKYARKLHSIRKTLN